MALRESLDKVVIPSKLRMAPTVRGVPPELQTALNIFTREVETVLRAQTAAIKELQEAVNQLLSA